MLPRMSLNPLKGLAHWKEDEEDDEDEDEDAKDEEDTGTALLKSHVGEIQSFDPAPCSVTMQCKSFAN